MDDFLFFNGNFGAPKPPRKFKTDEKAQNRRIIREGHIPELPRIFIPEILFNLMVMTPSQIYLTMEATLVISYWILCIDKRINLVRLRIPYFLSKQTYKSVT